ncbi:MAG TPA: nucleotide exchange factor GrpE [Polyangiaceae bacterium]|nr:nucleotide exchange factor GrpE [Polyangiaceae bacterium]
MSTETDPQKASVENGSSPSEASQTEAKPTEVATPVAPAPDGPEVEIAKLKDRLLRTAADFDNYRKRSRRDLEEAEKRVQENLVRSLLPTFDNLERAVAHAESATDVKALADGIKLVMRQFQDTLSGLGIERVQTVGKAFDPAEHEAVQHVVSTEVPPGAIVTELQPGYRWQGRLMRPALVVVSKAASPSSPPPKEA